MAEGFITRRGTPPELFTPIQATGGTITDIGNFRYHAFTSVGTSTFTVSDTGTDGLIDYLIVAGGGAGGNYGGGGGAGGVVTNVFSSPLHINTGSNPVIVGAGGASTGTTQGQGNDGENSSVFGLVALGGGGGGGRVNPENGNGRNGGSGGGAATGGSGNRLVGTGLQPSAASFGFGNNGGNSSIEHIPTLRFQSGGGGGAQSPGQNANAKGDRFGGDGGSGINLSPFFPIAGTNASNTTAGTLGFFAGGGGGSGHNSGNVGSGPIGGNGGAGGGGNGGTEVQSGFPGLANTGGGGGGVATSGSSGAGGSGIVIIRYPLEDV